MRIGIDGYNLALSQGTGVATYARELARTVGDIGWQIDMVYGLNVSERTPPAAREAIFFARLGEGEQGDRALKPTLRRTIARALTLPTARRLVEIPVANRVIRADFALKLPSAERLFTLGSLFSVSARYFRRFGRFMPIRMPAPPTLMHWTYPVPIILEGAANLYTIHDLVPLRLPHTSLEDKAYYAALIDRCVRTAAHIVTVSEASRRDIVEMFAASPERVANTYQRVDMPASGDDAARALRLARLFDLRDDGYFLFFGAIEPKKNVGRMLEAYLASGIDTPLVIVGAGGWDHDRELALLDQAGGRKLLASGQIRRMDYLPRDLLLEVVRGARAVLFPSLYEGFGLPAVEALALGRPVIASSTGSLPEVVGEAAVTVDPYDVGALTAAIVRMDGDATLRAELSAAAPEQADNFSAARYRQRLSDLYARVAGSTSSRPHRSVS